MAIEKEQHKSVKEIIKNDLKILMSNEVQNRISEIKNTFGLVGRDISRSEQYSIFEQLIKEGYDVQEYLEHIKNSDNLVDKIVSSSNNIVELRNALEKSGFTIIYKYKFASEYAVIIIQSDNQTHATEKLKDIVIIPEDFKIVTEKYDEISNTWS